mmetsp:Transcript_2013/g.2608  ORF Transcript_2013/g.2608 Transcript_2013/m.2608 type:complete len:105 (+) Transcript_2013:1358-1672(+)
MRKTSSFILGDILLVGIKDGRLFVFLLFLFRKWSAVLVNIGSNPTTRSREKMASICMQGLKKRDDIEAVVVLGVASVPGVASDSYSIVVGMRDFLASSSSRLLT